MAFIRVGDVLTKRNVLFNQERRVIDAVSIIAAWPAVLKEIKCGEKFERTRPLSYKQGRLTIQAASASIASELKMCEPKIINTYTKRFKSAVVKQLIIKRV